jgi:hypothetical protein
MVLVPVLVLAAPVKPASARSRLVLFVLISLAQLYKLSHQSDNDDKIELL